MNRKITNPYNSDELTPMTCICCGKEIHMLDTNANPGNSNPESDMWNDGVVASISAGYGSLLDGNVYLIAICDKCLERKNKEGSVVYLYDYMTGGISNKVRNDLNKTLHRKIKLKRILKK